MGRAPRSLSPSHEDLQIDLAVAAGVAVRQVHDVAVVGALVLQLHSSRVTDTSYLLGFPRTHGGLGRQLQLQVNDLHAELEELSGGDRVG